MASIPLNNPNIPLIGAKSEQPDLETCFTTTVAAQSRAVAAVWAQMHEFEYGSAEWNLLAQRFARHILGLEAVGSLARAAADAKAKQPIVP